MKLFRTMKDGGDESTVWGHFLFEIKPFASVALLHFMNGSREAFHNHAFAAISWVLRGKLIEHWLDGTVREYRPSLIPIYTPRSRFHKVVSEGDTWVLTLRGPWTNRWQEYLPNAKRFLTLTHGRREVSV